MSTSLAGCRRGLDRPWWWVVALSALNASGAAAVEGPALSAAVADVRPVSLQSGPVAFEPVAVSGLGLSPHLPLHWKRVPGSFQEWLDLPQARFQTRGWASMQPAFAGNRSDGSSDRSRAPRGKLYWSAALALTAGAVAYWSNREADDAYDSYLRSAGSSRQLKEFDRAERYDRISGAAFIGMEIGIVLSTYLVFFGS